MARTFGAHPQTQPDRPSPRAITRRLISSRRFSSGSHRELDRTCSSSNGRVEVTDVEPVVSACVTSLPRRATGLRPHPGPARPAQGSWAAQRTLASADRSRDVRPHPHLHVANRRPIERGERSLRRAGARLSTSRTYAESLRPTMPARPVSGSQSALVHGDLAGQHRSLARSPSRRSDVTSRSAVSGRRITGMPDVPGMQGRLAPLGELHCATESSAALRVPPGTDAHIVYRYEVGAPGRSWHWIVFFDTERCNVSAPPFNDALPTARRSRAVPEHQASAEKHRQ